MMRALIFLIILSTLLHPKLQGQTNPLERSIQLYKENKLEEAARFSRQAIDNYSTIARKDSLVFAYVQQALIVWDAVSAGDALKVLDTAFQVLNSLPPRHLAAVAAYSRAGQVYNQQQDFTKAAKLLQSGLRAIPGGDSINKQVVNLYNNNAILYLMQDRYEEARIWAQRAYQLNLRFQGKEGPDMPGILQTIYYISQYSEKYQQALKDGLELQRVMLLHYPPGHRAIGILHNSLGNIYEALLQYEEALFHRRKAADIQLANYNKAKNNGFSLATAYHNLGNLYSYINEHYLAQEYLSKGSFLFEQVYGPEELGMVKILIGLADNKRKLQAWAEAEKIFERAYQLQQRHAADDHSGMAYVESFYGDLFLDQRQFERAGIYYRRSLQHFKQAGALQTRLALQTRKALADVLSGTGKYDSAISIQQKLVSAFRAIYPRGNDGIAGKYSDISRIYLAANKPQQALAWSDSVFSELTGIKSLRGNTNWVSKLPFSYNTATYIEQRMRLLQLLNTSAGKKETDEILQLADRYTDYISLYLSAFRTQATLKELAAVHKQIYSTAIETCWSVYKREGREQMVEKALAYSEQSKAFQLRLASNNLLVDAAATGNNAIAARDHEFRKHIGELNAQFLNEERVPDSLLNQLSAGIEAYRIFQDSIRQSGNTALAAKYRLAPYTVSEIRKRLLTGDETMVEYVVTDENIFAFVVSKTTCHFQHIDRGALKDIKALQQLNVLTPKAFADPAFRLYAALVQPLQKYMKQERLFIVPDGELYYLNFEMLVSDASATRFSDMPFLIRTYDISYLLSATSTIQLSESYPLRRNEKALLIAPVFTDEMKDQVKHKAAAGGSGDEYLYLHRQPFALEAAQHIGQLMPHDLYKEQQAQEKVFKESAGSYRLLHLGTHAAINDAAQLQSRLYFAQALPDDSANLDDGYLHVYEIYAMQLQAELAVLSACETGAGTLQEGEGIMSLSHSFMYAGCKGVVMSAWKIDEKSSMQIITDFYKYLSKGYTKSEALRKAKLNLMATPGGKMQHPYYWAGLTLIGDSSPVFSSNQWFYCLVGLTAAALIGALVYNRNKRTRRNKIGKKQF